jgi:23S rRNA (uracil1939-C5)-methyltransferase
MTDSLLPHSLFPLQIEKLVYGGDGLARHENGEVFFVPYGIPGEQVLVTRQQSKRKPTKAYIETIEQASEDRVIPRCDVFGTCGGCQWQHIASSVQRDWKQHIVEETLQRLGGFQPLTVTPTSGCDELSWQYRNRVQWDVQSSEDGRVIVGYREGQSHRVVPFRRCYIIPDGMNEFYHHLSQSLNQIINQHGQVGLQCVQSIRRIEVSQSPQQDLMVSIDSNDHPLLQELAIQLVAADIPIAGIVHCKTARKHGQKRMTVLSGEVSSTFRLMNQAYQVSVGSFFQTNYAAAEAMIRQIQAWLPMRVESLLDLYSGVGLFGLALSQRAERIVMVEQSGSSVDDAKASIQREGFTHITVQEGDVSQVVLHLKDNFEVAILDPPRQGSSSVVLEWLARHVMKQIIYVSCDPTTLARDLKQLASLGWAIQTVQPIDMFPQTYHVETLVQLLPTNPD